MGCFVVNIREEGKHLQVSCGSANSLLQVEAKSLHSFLDAGCTLLKSKLHADSKLINIPLNVSFSLVCDCAIILGYLFTSDKKALKTADGKFFKAKGK